MTESFYKNLFQLDGKVIVITGATGILGRQFCQAFLEMGGQVAMIDLDADKLDQQKKDLEQFSNAGDNCLGYMCDITQKDQIELTIDQILKEFGKIDVLHNNAASKSNDLKAFFSATEEYPAEIWQQVIDVNLTGAFNMAQAVGRYMVEKQSGSIINTASIYGIMGADQRIYEGAEYMGAAINNPAVYSASKAGLLGLTRHLAAQWGPAGVRVNAVTPGGVSSGQNGEFHKKYSARVPMGRMAYEHEISGAVLFLASDASSYVNGQNIAVDGGLSSW